jgi:hypothetical protein
MALYLFVISAPTEVPEVAKLQNGSHFDAIQTTGFTTTDFRNYECVKAHSTLFNQSFKNYICTPKGLL